MSVQLIKCAKCGAETKVISGIAEARKVGEINCTNCDNTVLTYNGYKTFSLVLES